MPLKPCLACGRLTKGSYCSKHQPVRRVVSGCRVRPSPSSLDRPPPALVSKVKLRDGCCRRCGSTGSPDNPVRIDNVRPVALGGDHDQANLVRLCSNYHRARPEPRRSDAAVGSARSYGGAAPPADGSLLRSRTAVLSRNLARLSGWALIDPLGSMLPPYLPRPHAE